MKSALVLGATGATGKDLVTILLNSGSYDEVHIFVRRPVAEPDTRLKVHLVDFEKPAEWAGKVRGTVAFSCMGTTLKDAGSKEAQWKVDYDYQYQFAEAAKRNGVETFVLVSAVGADPASRIFYSRMKGALEVAVKKLDFNNTLIFNPGALVRVGTSRKGELLSIKALQFFNSLGLFRKYAAISTLVLARAMVNAVAKASGKFSHFDTSEIVTMSDN